MSGSSTKIRYNIIMHMGQKVTWRGPSNTARHGVVVGRKGGGWEVAVFTQGADTGERVVLPDPKVSTERAEPIKKKRGFWARLFRRK